MLIIQHVSPKNADILLHNCSKINTLQFKIDKTLQFYIQSFPVVLISSTAVFYFYPHSVSHQVSHIAFCLGVFLFPFTLDFFPFMTLTFFGDPAHLFCRIFVWLFPHDQIQIKHFCQELVISIFLSVSHWEIHDIPLAHCCSY